MVLELNCNKIIARGERIMSASHCTTESVCMNHTVFINDAVVSFLSCII